MGWGTATGAGGCDFRLRLERRPAGGAGAGWVGTTMFWLGLGRNATVGRMLIASAISSATTALMKTTASVLPTSRTDLRRVRGLVETDDGVGVGVLVWHRAVGDVGLALASASAARLAIGPVFGLISGQ